MARPGAGKRKMQAQRKKQWNSTVKSLKSTGRALRGGKRRKKNGCYVATCVYGSYDCPEVWTLRRFRDNTLAEYFFGRVFITLYYAISPMLVKSLGKNRIITNHWRRFLDKLVTKLNRHGIEDAPYCDH